MTQPLSPADQAKINAGAIAYLDVSDDMPNKSNEFLDGLHYKLGWTPTEIAQLRLRAVKITLDRLKK